MPPHGGLPWLTLARHDPRCHPEVRHTRPAGVTPPRCERDVITYHLHFGQWARGIVTEAGRAQGPGPVWQAMGVATGPANDGKPAWAGPRGRLQKMCGPAGGAGSGLGGRHPRRLRTATDIEEQRLADDR